MHPKVRFLGLFSILFIALSPSPETQANLASFFGFTDSASILQVNPPVFLCDSLLVPVRRLTRGEAKELFISDPIERGEFDYKNPVIQNDWLNWRPPSVYRKAKRILVLSDGSETDSGIGDLLRYKLNAHIFKTDIDVLQEVHYDKFHALPMDNTRPFPFEDASIDLIMLRRGLCNCSGHTCCAGFAPQSPEAARFLREVVRVMNSRRDSDAYLEGGANLKRSDLYFWLKTVLEIQAHQPQLRFEILSYKETHDSFAALHLFMRR